MIEAFGRVGSPSSARKIDCAVADRFSSFEDAADSDRSRMLPNGASSAPSSASKRAISFAASEIKVRVSPELLGRRNELLRDGSCRARVRSAQFLGIYSVVTRRIADRYLLENQLGAGGTSRVHAALDERLGRQVAIKLLDAQLVASADPAGRERFLREGPTSASFSHRNAVTIFDCGEDDGDLYIVMELVDGPSLAERIAKNGPLPVQEATDIASQVLAALSAAHAVGIVHRDVKPANVLLGTNGDVKLADFGIAKRFDDLEDSVTSTGMVIGTPRYLAPEQATGSPATSATDVYGVGILLFEMLTAQPPFSGGSLAAISAAQQSQPAPDVRSLRPEISAGLAATVARALATKPAKRFSSAAEMSSDLLDDDATHVMQTAPQGGDTQIMTRPLAVAPSTAAAAAVPVVRVARSRPAATSSEPMKARTGLIVVGLAVIAAVIVIAMTGRDRTTAFTVPSTIAGQVAPEETIPIAPEILTSFTTDVAAASADEVIPGFPLTYDIEVFLLQLEANPALVGEKGEELASQLRDMLDERSGKKRRDRAEQLREEMDTWVADGELDPTIADALKGLLDVYVED